MSALAIYSTKRFSVLVFIPASSTAHNYFPTEFRTESDQIFYDTAEMQRNFRVQSAIFKKH